MGGRDHRRHNRRRIFLSLQLVGRSGGRSTAHGATPPNCPAGIGVAGVTSTTGQGGRPRARHACATLWSDRCERQMRNGRRPNEKRRKSRSNERRTYRETSERTARQEKTRKTVKIQHQRLTVAAADGQKRKCSAPGSQLTQSVFESTIMHIRFMDSFESRRFSHNESK